MSQAIAQSATQLTVSGSVEPFDINTSISRNGIRAIKNPANNAMTERVTLSFSKLLQAVRTDWKMHHNNVSKVPDETDTIIQTQVQAFIGIQLAKVNYGNAVSTTTRDVLNFKNLSIEEKVTSTGINILELQRQLEGCNRLIRANNDKLAQYEKMDASGGSHKDYSELIKSAKRRGAELQLTLNHIKGTIEENKKVAPQS